MFISFLLVHSLISIQVIHLPVIDLDISPETFPGASFILRGTAIRQRYNKNGQHLESIQYYDRGVNEQGCS